MSIGTIDKIPSSQQQAAEHKTQETEMPANKVKYSLKKYGAVEQSKLELFSAPELLEELEAWSTIISFEPELQRALSTSSDALQPEMEP